MTSVKKGTPGWLYDGISGTDGDSDHGPCVLL